MKYSIFIGRENNAEQLSLFIFLTMLYFHMFIKGTVLRSCEKTQRTSIRFKSRVFPQMFSHIRSTRGMINTSVTCVRVRYIWTLSKCTGTTMFHKVLTKWIKIVTTVCTLNLKH